LKEIELTKGMIAIVDDEDYEDLNKHLWHVNSGGYAARMIKHPTMPTKKKKQVVLQMHRYLMGLSYGDPLVVDHIDGNKLNNTRSNLRVCTFAENAKNKPGGINNISGYKGVYTYQTDRWRACISNENKFFHIGVYDTPEQAYAAYCEAARKLHGQFANFGTIVKKKIKRKIDTLTIDLFPELLAA
jgi:hypothetical protein